MSPCAYGAKVHLASSLAVEMGRLHTRTRTHNAACTQAWACTARCARQESEDEEAGKVEYECRAKVEEDKDDARDEVDWLPALELAGWSKQEGSHAQAQNEQADGE